MKILLTSSCSIFVFALLMITIPHSNPRMPIATGIDGQSLGTPQRAAVVSDTFHTAGALSHSPFEARVVPSSSVTFKTAESEGNKVAELYVIKVVEDDSHTPIVNARVRVLIAGPPTAKREGRTDGSGLYIFNWRPFKKNIRAHISVQAEGFVNLDDDSPLAQDRVVQLERTKGTALSCAETTGDWRAKSVIRFSDDRIDGIVPGCSPRLPLRLGLFIFLDPPLEAIDDHPEPGCGADRFSSRIHPRGRRQNG